MIRERSIGMQETPHRSNQKFGLAAHTMFFAAHQAA
jgi:hypothetical protein